MEKRSLSPGTREIQMKTMWGYYFKATKLAEN